MGTSTTVVLVADSIAVTHQKEDSVATDVEEPLLVKE